MDLSSLLLINLTASDPRRWLTMSGVYVLQRRAGYLQQDYREERGKEEPEILVSAEVSES